MLFFPKPSGFHMLPIPLLNKRVLKIFHDIRLLFDVNNVYCKSQKKENVALSLNPSDWKSAVFQKFGGVLRCPQAAPAIVLRVKSRDVTQLFSFLRADDFPKEKRLQKKLSRPKVI